MLKIAVKLTTPRHYVGTLGVVYNDAGQILFVEHVFRPYFPWGLPGGWINRGERPVDALKREIKEELGLQVNVKRLLLCDQHKERVVISNGLTMAFYCRLTDTVPLAEQMRDAPTAHEVLGAEWVDPDHIPWTLTTLEQKAISLSRAEFARDQ